MLALTGARLRDEFQGARFKSPLRDKRWGGDVMYQRRSAGKTACVGENRARQAVDSFSQNLSLQELRIQRSFGWKGAVLSGDDPCWLVVTDVSRS